VSRRVGGPGTKVIDQPGVLVLGQRVKYGRIDFGIGKLFGNIFGVPMQGEKMIRLPQGPYPGFPHMDGRMIEFSREGHQV